VLSLRCKYIRPEATICNEKISSLFKQILRNVYMSLNRSINSSESPPFFPKLETLTYNISLDKCTQKKWVRFLSKNVHICPVIQTKRPPKLEAFTIENIEISIVRQGLEPPTLAPEANDVLFISYCFYST